MEHRAESAEHEAKEKLPSFAEADESSAEHLKVAKPTIVDRDTHDPHRDTLEERLKRLEDAIASLQNAQDIEDRLAERLRGELKSMQPPAPDPKPEEKIVDTAKHRSPLTQFLWPDRSKEVESTPRPKNIAGAAANTANVYREAWFAMGTWRELRAIFRMFFDVRYRVAWTVRVLVFILLPTILLSHVFITIFNVLWPFGQILDKVLALFLGFFLYKALSREARRYMLTQEEPEI